MNNLVRLAELLRKENEALILEWRQQEQQLPSARHLDAPTIVDHVPSLLVELADALQHCADETIVETVCGSSPAHGLQRAADGFDIVEVVSEYNILRGCINDMAERHGLTLRGKAFHILNRILDSAIGAAVQTFATQRAIEVQRRREEHLAFVTHDLRTPLNAIAMVAKYLERGVAEMNADADMQRMIKTLTRNTGQLGSLVNKVMQESSSLETEVGVKIEKRRFDLWPLVQGLIHELHPIAGTNSTHLVNQVPEDMEILADASLLTRIFQNLIANAIAHTPRGQVTIGASFTGDGDVVECSVSDDGTGIAADRLTVIFDKFETDNQSGESLGLGLAIVKTFVEAHGGTVSVESAPDAGSRFRFTLPGQQAVSEPAGDR